MMMINLSACNDNDTPIADAGGDKNVVFGKDPSTIKLNGSASYDPNGDSLSYHWQIISVPENSQAELSAYDKKETSLSMDIEGDYEIALIVTDGEISSVQDIIVVHYQEGVSKDDAESAASNNGILNQSQTHKNVDNFENELCNACHPIDTKTQEITTIHDFIFGDCRSCHSPASWSPTVRFLHDFVEGQCNDCHNGTLAIYKSDTHISASENCQDCHITYSWFNSVNVRLPSFEVDLVFNHVGIVDQCVYCHNGVNAIGKSVSHIESSDKCSTCHITNNWQFIIANITSPSGGGGTTATSNIQFDHTGILSSCNVCHDGSTASALPDQHILSTEKCEKCHTVFNWATDSIDHSQIFGDCIDCHTGDIISGKSLDHALTTDLCDTCHSTTSFIPVAVTDHELLIDTCIICHDGLVTDGKNELHIASSDECEFCHDTQQWTLNTIIDHAHISEACETCHAAPGNHLDRGISTNCDNCHRINNEIGLTFGSPLNPLP